MIFHFVANLIPLDVYATALNRVRQEWYRRCGNDTRRTPIFASLYSGCDSLNLGSSSLAGCPTDVQIS